MSDLNHPVEQSLKFDRILLARIGEITLKGMNRHKFEEQVIRNMRHRLKEIGSFTITPSHSRIWIEWNEAKGETRSESDPVDRLSIALERVKDIFGIVSVSPVRRFPGGIEEIERQAVDFVRELLVDGNARTFKVETRRGDKSFPLDSPQISERIGGKLLDTFGDQLTVQVKNPDFVLYIEVRDQVYLYSSIVKAHRGLPVGTGGSGLLLLSGGIDSPVAGYMMASRGMELQAIYFHAFPFTSDQAKEKVIELAGILARYCGPHPAAHRRFHRNPADPARPLPGRHDDDRHAADDDADRRPTGRQARLQGPDHRRKPRPGGQPDARSALVTTD